MREVASSCFSPFDIIHLPDFARYFTYMFASIADKKASMCDDDNANGSDRFSIDCDRDDRSGLGTRRDSRATGRYE